LNSADNEKSFPAYACFSYILGMRETFLPTIGELTVFCACVRTGAPPRASEELGLTQSAISRALSSLEQRLGVRLFHRVKQRLVLSDAGRAFSSDAESLVHDLREASIAVMAFGGRTGPRPFGSSSDCGHHMADSQTDTVPGKNSLT
jgi:DNA-binding transcriptional LysR family regulator